MEDCIDFLSSERMEVHVLLQVKQGSRKRESPVFQRLRGVSSAPQIDHAKIRVVHLTNNSRQSRPSERSRVGNPELILRNVGEELPLPPQVNVARTAE